jgi:hypothetical protein
MHSTAEDAADAAINAPNKLKLAVFGVAALIGLAAVLMIGWE